MAIGNIVVVEPGDTLSSIALEFLGDAKYASVIAEMNRIDNPDLIFPGLGLRLPKKSGPDAPLVIGDIVEKTTGDYRYKGMIVAAFTKKNGQRRFVVENDDGMLFIFNERQLTRV